MQKYFCSLKKYNMMHSLAMIELFSDTEDCKYPESVGETKICK